MSTDSIELKDLTKTVQAELPQQSWCVYVCVCVCVRACVLSCVLSRMIGDRYVSPCVVYLFRALPQAVRRVRRGAIRGHVSHAGDGAIRGVRACR